MAGKKSNPKKKERCKAQWARGEVRKDARRKAQEERAAANRATRAAGGLTPWEKAKAIRAGRRAAA